VSGAQLDGNLDQLVRVVHNLLDNAARHARSKVVVTLSETATHVTLRVLDDGPGIPDRDRVRVFERFARLDADRGRDGGGAGLGLAIVHDVVAAHGGSVAVENVPGAAFTVVLPVHAGV
jgi:signal transduction histidine kinase